jgi:hypothetical protein
MTLDLRRLLLGLRFGAGLALTAAGTSAGCSSSSATSGPPVPPAGNACPGTVEATVGAACDSPGEVCSPTFPCGLATVTVRCICQEGTFQCTDGSGNPFASGGTPSCGEAGPAPMACPATESAAMTTACTLAEDGQQCPYPPSCPGGTLTFDRCTCEPNLDGSGFAYACENACHSGSVPVPEAGTSPGGGDGSSDAPAGDGPGGDAHAGDGAPTGGDGAVEADDGGSQGDVAVE